MKATLAAPNIVLEVSAETYDRFRDIRLAYDGMTEAKLLREIFEAIPEDREMTEDDVIEYVQMLEGGLQEAQKESG